MRLKLSEIKALVEGVTGVKIDNSQLQEVLFARYLVAVIANEENYEKATIARFLDKSYGAIVNTFKSAANLLETDQKFKKMYLDCIAEIAQIEENE